MMDKEFYQNLRKTLAHRARLSMLGKGIIGAIGGTIILLITFFRSCNHNDSIQLESQNVDWVSHTVLDLATTLDSIKRVEHFSTLGISINQADSIGNFIASRNIGGVSVSELNKGEIDSLNGLFNLSIPTVGADNIVFYIHSFKQEDYIIVTNDSLLVDIIRIPGQ